MELIKDMEAFMHLFAQALAKAKGDEQPHIFADVVVGHARDIAKQDDETGEITEAVQKDDDALKAAAPVEPEAPAEDPPAEEHHDDQQ